MERSLTTAALLELQARATGTGRVPADLAAFVNEGASLRREVHAALEEVAVHVHHAGGSADQEPLALRLVDRLAVGP